MRFCYLAILTILTISGCKSKEPELTEKPRFTSFELAYSDGWSNGQTFRVDSSGIFFVPLTSDLLQYGLLPDSIVKLIDNTLTYATQDSSVKSRDDSCEDCPLIEVIAKKGDRDIRISQSGKIDSSLLTIVSEFKNYIRKNTQRTINASLVLETQKIVWPPPPPPRPLPKNFDLKFKPPIEDRMAADNIALAYMGVRLGNNRPHFDNQTWVSADEYYLATE